MNDVLLLLARIKETPADQFESEIAAAVASVPNRQLAFLMSADALPALAHVSKPDPALPDAIVTLADAPAPALLAALAPLIDPARSELLVVRRHAVLPGDDAIRLVFGLRRLERLTLAAFHDYWLNRHAEIASGNFGIRLPSRERKGKPV